MVMRLKTARGDIHEYATSYGTSYGEGGPYVFYSPCGRKWHYEPAYEEQCNHLDCAISIANGRRHWHRSFVFLIVIPLIALIVSQYELLWLIFLLPAFGTLFFGLRGEKQFEELAEYRDNGTINGIKAWQVSQDEGVRTLQIQTEDGEIKEYDCIPLGNTFYDYWKWISKSGTEWNRKAEIYQECDDLERAIRIAEWWHRYRMIGRFFAAAATMSFIALFISENRIMPLMIFVFSIIMAIVFWGLSQVHKDHWDELREFKNNGTINGIKSSQIPNYLKQ